MKKEHCLVEPQEYFDGRNGMQVRHHCIYCKRKEGEEHAEGCVCRTRTVVLHVTFQIVESVPEDWTPAEIENHYNLGSWCLDNVLPVLDGIVEREGCLCGRGTVHYFREATDTEPEDVGIVQSEDGEDRQEEQ